MDTITEEEYDEEVTELATFNASDAEGAVEEDIHDNIREAVFAFCEEDVTHHEWFARDYYGASLYGCIIEHSDVDVGRYNDWYALSEADTPSKSVKRLAHAVMEAEVIDRTFRLLDDD